MNKFSFVLLLSFLFYACSNDDEGLTEQDAIISEYLSAESIDATKTSSGIYYFSISTDADNQGDAVASNDVVSFYYSLSDLEGNLIAEYGEEDGDPLQFKQGVSAVYPVGLDEAVLLMSVGDTFGFILPTDLGYESLNSNIIDSDEIVRIDLTVSDVQSEDAVYEMEVDSILQYIDDNNLNDVSSNPTDVVVQIEESNLFYKTVVEGTGDLTLAGDSVTIDYTLYSLDDVQYATDTDFRFIYGSSDPRALVSGLEEGLALMQSDEQALLLMPSSLGYKESAQIVPSFIAADLAADGIIPDYVITIPPYTSLIFDVTRNE